MSAVIGSLLGFLVVGGVVGGVVAALYAFVKPLLPKKPDTPTPENS